MNAFKTEGFTGKNNMIKSAQVPPRVIIANRPGQKQGDNV